MFCRNCGNEIQGLSVIACMKCGCNPNEGTNYCPNCGASTTDKQIVCVKCGVGLQSENKRTSVKKRKNAKDKTTAGLLALFLGAIGIHQFYLGNSTSGILRIVIFTVGALVAIGPFITSIIALIEGIKYLTMSDEDFEETYVQNKRAWF
ncbi:MAG: NINE protein [Thermoguttaceae bacterium]